MMLKLRLVAAFLGCSLCLSTIAETETGLIRPAKDSVYATLLEGLKLLAVGDVDAWVTGYCDVIRLCKNEAELEMIRQHRAPVQEKVAPTCLKDGDRALHVTRVIGDPQIDIAVKIYLQCDPTDPPRFYSLRKTADYWFFISL